MSKIEVIYWDSTVFIDAIQQKNPSRTQVLQRLIEVAEESQIRLLTSTLTKVDVCKVKGDGLSAEEQERQITDFFDNDYITVRPVDDEIAEMARHISRRSAGVKPADSIHLATAILNHASVMHTYDEKLRKQMARFEGLTVEEPQWRGQQVLPEMENFKSTLPFDVSSGVTINRRSVEI